MPGRIRDSSDRRSGVEVGGVPLMRNEAVLEDVNPSWTSYTWLLAFAVLVLLAGIVETAVGDDDAAGAAIVGIVLFSVFVGYVVWRRSKTHYVVTDQRVVKRTGLLRTNVQEAAYAAISAVNTEQGTFQSLFGDGTVRIGTTTGAGTIELTGVPSHHELATLVRQRHPTLSARGGGTPRRPSAGRQQPPTGRQQPPGQGTAGRQPPEQQPQGREPGPPQRQQRDQRRNEPRPADTEPRSQPRTRPSQRTPADASASERRADGRPPRDRDPRESRRQANRRSPQDEAAHDDHDDADQPADQAAHDDADQPADEGARGDREPAGEAASGTDDGGENDAGGEDDDAGGENGGGWRPD